MMGIRFWWKATAVFSVLAALVGFAGWQYSDSLSRRAELAAAVAGANRVVVVTGMFEPRREDCGQAVFEVHGEAEAAARPREDRFREP